MKTIIIMASTKKEAKGIALQQYGENCVYIQPHFYSSPGNNFYEFKMPLIEYQEMGNK